MKHPLWLLALIVLYVTYIGAMAIATQIRIHYYFGWGWSECAGWIFVAAILGCCGALVAIGYYL